MKYSVILQDPFDFAPFWLILGIGLLLAAAVCRILLRLIRHGRFVRWRRPHPFRAVRLFFLRIWYLLALRRIERDFRKNRIDSREAHQRMSRVVRLFASAATGKPVTRMVHSEVSMLQYPRLTGLIGSLYEPEFSPRPSPEIRQMIQKSKELISQWR